MDRPFLSSSTPRSGAANRAICRFIRITVFNASDRRRYERELLEARRTAERANAELLKNTLERRVAEAAEVA